MSILRRVRQNGSRHTFTPRRGEGPQAGAPVNAFVCTIGVESIDDTIAAIGKCGGQIVVEKMEIPTVGWLCYANDLDGNLFGVMEPV